MYVSTTETALELVVYRITLTSLVSKKTIREYLPSKGGLQVASLQISEILSSHEHFLQLANGLVNLINSDERKWSHQVPGSTKSF